MNFKSVWEITKETVQHFISDRVLTLGAALAYYAIFSIGPLLIIATGIAGMVLSEESAKQQIIQEVDVLAGQKVSQMIKLFLATQTKSNNLHATIIGLVILFFLASMIFNQLKVSLNFIWKIKPKPGRGILGLIRDQVFSLSLVVVLGVMLIILMLFSTLISIFTNAIESVIHVPAFVVQSLNLSISFVAITVLFAMIFKILPHAKARWRDIAAGSFATAILFVIGEYLLRFFIAHQNLISLYGAAGSLVIIMVWIYYSSLIFFFGAEFIQVYARRVGAPIVRSKHTIFDLSIRKIVRNLREKKTL